MMTREEKIAILKDIIDGEIIHPQVRRDVGIWAIKALEQEPKTGHWKRISMDRYTTHAHYWYKCDKCGEHNLGNTDYCPNCGCRMVEPQESEE